MNYLPYMLGGAAVGLAARGHPAEGPESRVERLMDLLVSGPRQGWEELEGQKRKGRERVRKFSLPRVPMRVSRGRALPVFSRFRQDYCEGKSPNPTTAWVRLGNPNVFSEFTLGLRGGPAQMGGGRGSGTLTGQYSLGRWAHASQWNSFALERLSQEGSPPFGLVPPPLHPFVVPRARSLDFNSAVKDILRAASREDPSRYLAQRDASRHLRTNQSQVLSAISAWRRTQIVHPVNILLSRMGYDGLSYADPAEASSFSFGNVRFPPINSYGIPVGMKVVSNRRMVPACSRALPFTPLDNR